MTNAWDVLRYLIMAGVVLYLWREARPLAQQWMTWRTLPPAKALESVELPRDLDMLAANFDEEWAREDARRLMLELYGELRDWEAVRAAYHARQAIGN